MHSLRLVNRPESSRLNLYPCLTRNRSDLRRCTPAFRGPDRTSQSAITRPAPRGPMRQPGPDGRTAGRAPPATTAGGVRHGAGMPLTLTAPRVRVPAAPAGEAGARPRRGSGTARRARSAARCHHRTAVRDPGRPALRPGPRSRRRETIQPAERPPGTPVAAYGTADAGDGRTADQEPRLDPPLVGLHPARSTCSGGEQLSMSSRGVPGPLPRRDQAGASTTAPADQRERAFGAGRGRRAQGR